MRLAGLAGLRKPEILIWPGGIRVVYSEERTSPYNPLQPLYKPLQPLTAPCNPLQLLTVPYSRSQPLHSPMYRQLLQVPVRGLWGAAALPLPIRHAAGAQQQRQQRQRQQ